MGGGIEKSQSWRIPLLWYAFVYMCRFYFSEVPSHKSLDCRSLAKSMKNTVRSNQHSSRGRPLAGYLLTGITLGHIIVFDTQADQAIGISISHKSFMTVLIIWIFRPKSMYAKLLQELRWIIIIKKEHWPGSGCENVTTWVGWHTCQLVQGALLWGLQVSLFPLGLIKKLEEVFHMKLKMEEEVTANRTRLAL